MSHLHSRGNKSQTKFVVWRLNSVLSLALAFSIIFAMSGQPQEASAAPVADAAKTADSGAAIIQSVQETVDPANDRKAIKNSENVPEMPDAVDPSDISQYKIRPDSLDLTEASARKSQDKLEFKWQEEEEDNSPGLQFSGDESK